MGEAWEWIKSHPVYVIGGIGALVVVYLLLSSRGSTAAQQQVVTGPQQPSDAAVQSAAAVQTAQLQLSAQNNQLQAQLAATQSNNATAVTIAGLQGRVAQYQTEQAANVQEAGISAQKDVSLAGVQSQQAIASYAAQTQQHQDDLAAQVQIANAATYAQIASLQTQATTAQTQAYADVQKTQAQYAFLGSAIQSQTALKKSSLNITTPGGASVSFVNAKGPAGGTSAGGILGGIGSILGALF